MLTMMRYNLHHSWPAWPEKSSDRQAVNWQFRFSLLSDQAKDPRLKAYYQAAHIHGNTPVQQVEFLALDLETRDKTMLILILTGLILAAALT